MFNDIWPPELLAAVKEERFRILYGGTGLWVEVWLTAAAFLAERNGLLDETFGKRGRDRR